MSLSELLKWCSIVDYSRHFPGVYIALRLYLTLPVSNCEGARPFYQMSRITNKLNKDKDDTDMPEHAATRGH